MEVVLFTIAGIALYFFSDWVLNTLEQIHGEALPQRNVVFFVLILSLSLASFSLMRAALDDGERPQNHNEKEQATNGGDQPT